MAIPLPQVVADVGPGGPLVTALQGMNALRQSNATAKYAPYQAYADAYLKNQQAQWLPYQYRMQALSNPMLWMAAQSNPALRDQITKMMSDPMQGMGGSVNIPPPQGSSGNGMLSMLLNKIGMGGSDNSNPMQSMPSPDQGGQSSGNAMLSPPNANGSPSAASTPSGTGSPMVPSTQGPMAAIGAKAMSGYNQQIPDPGKTYQDPNTGQVISAPTARTATALQTSITAAKRVAPQLERIANHAAPFMTLGGEANTFYQRGKNYAFGGKSELPSQYANFQSELKAAPESLVKAYGLNPTNETIERMASVIEPLRGETAETYKQRILTTLDNIKNEQEKQPEGQLYGGINVSPSDQQSTASSGNGFDPKKMLDYKYSNAEEFRRAFNSLNDESKNLVRKEMKSRGWK